jgi:Peptidase family M28
MQSHRLRLRPINLDQVKTYFRWFAFFLALALAGAPPSFEPSPDMNRALAAVSADSLRGNLSFLASDRLEGRDTPSRGLDLAAGYIAAQFRRAGLEPAGDDGYFQTAHLLYTAPPAAGFELHLRNGSKTLAISKDNARIVSHAALVLAAAPLYKIGKLADLPAGDLTGKVVALDGADFRTLAKAAAPLRPAAFLLFDAEDEFTATRLIDPVQERAVFGGIPRIVLRDEKAAGWLEDAGAGPTSLTLSLTLPATTQKPVTVRNVIAVLRGSDPVLRDQYVLLTAHYDHLGVQASGRIFHGANDDGSGTVSVIEIGRALAALAEPPKRSIVFAAFFGEEEGCLGSLYYANHPVFPLARTVADLNLEQLGRTDSSAGPEVANATLTGFAYSDIAPVMQQAGRLTSIKVYQTPDDDQYFDRSDNETFAERGIPAHTLVVAFEYPDYHAVGDTWQKIDYANMAKVDRMIALGTILLANRPQAPQWTCKRPPH